MSRLLQRSSLDKALRLRSGQVPRNPGREMGGAPDFIRATTNSQPPTPNSQPLPSPHWREDFPINWDDDHYITRREFASFLTLISGVLFLGTGLVGLREWWKRWRPARPTPVRIAQVTEVPVGGVKLYHYPTPDDPCLLIRLSTDRFVAYSQKCTHLSCPVTYRAADQQLYCPCHEGRFAVEDGRALAGPPKRPLPRIMLRRRGEEIWATAVEV